MLVLLQMHGDPGSGKSTIARALATSEGIVHIDKDVILSAMLDSGAPEELARPLAHEVMWAMASDILAQGRSAVVDTPAWRRQTVERGQAIAAARDASYTMIECICPAEATDHRLRTRAGLRSHPVARIDWYREWSLERPTVPRLVIDTTRPLEICVREAMAHAFKAEESASCRE